MIGSCFLVVSELICPIDKLEMNRNDIRVNNFFI